MKKRKGKPSFVLLPAPSANNVMIQSDNENDENGKLTELLE